MKKEKKIYNYITTIKSLLKCEQKYIVVEIFHQQSRYSINLFVKNSEKQLIKSDTGRRKAASICENEYRK